MPRKRNTNQSLKQQKSGKNVMADASSSASVQSSTVTLNSKLQVLKQESLPTQMNLKPLCDTSAFQFTDDMKVDLHKENDRALGDISSNILNVQ